MRDPYFGRRVHDLIEGLGFMDVGHEGFTYILHGGDPMARSMAAIKEATKLLIDAGVCTQEDLDFYYRILLDPTKSFPGYTMFARMRGAGSQCRRTCIG